MAKNNATIRALKLLHQYERDTLPYYTALFALTLKHTTDISIEDIETIIDNMMVEANEWTAKGYSIQMVIQQCADETGLDLFTETNKAKISR